MPAYLVASFASLRAGSNASVCLRIGISLSLLVGICWMVFAHVIQDSLLLFMLSGILLFAGFGLSNGARRAYYLEPLPSIEAGVGVATWKALGPRFQTPITFSFEAKFLEPCVSAVITAFSGKMLVDDGVICAVRLLLVDHEGLELFPLRAVLAVSAVSQCRLILVAAPWVRASLVSTLLLLLLAGAVLARARLWPKAEVVERRLQEVQNDCGTFDWDQEEWSIRVVRCRPARKPATYGPIFSLENVCMKPCGKLPMSQLVGTNSQVTSISFLSLTASAEVVTLVEKGGPVYQLNVVSEGNDEARWMVTLPPARVLGRDDDRIGRQRPVAAWSASSKRT
ncbi:unnamed protein product [Durusdinium trenchii]|uniref:Transmembrane protein n=1 Tax=Durusdinium trenchii TaxID=1381693 RepID=A0ABP0HH10_9DINO